jgi:regulator of protease activity HflC (stomatin/prohibitin superfamily)
MSEFLRSLLSGVRRLRPFAVVGPWEQGVRIRFGKTAALLYPGFHLIIPILDRVLIHGAQRRTVNIPMQTVTTQDGAPITIAGACAYTIKNLLTLYKELHCPDDAVISFSQGAIAKFVTGRPVANVDPAKIAEFVVKEIDLTRYGLSQIEVFITDMVRVKTYRIINDSRYQSLGDILRLTGKQE